MNVRHALREYGFIVGIFAAIILALLTLNIHFQRSLKMEMAEQFNHQQLLLAKTEALRIESYLSVIKEDILHVAQFAAVMNVPKEADFRLLTDAVCRHIGDIKRRVVFLDSEGKIRFTRGTMAIQELDDKYFAKAVQSGCQDEIAIEQGSKRLRLTAPVCRSGSLTGALMVFIDLQDIATMFLSPIKSG